MNNYDKYDRTCRAWTQKPYNFQPLFIAIAKYNEFPVISETCNFHTRFNVPLRNRSTFYCRYMIKTNNNKKTYHKYPAIAKQIPETPDNVMHCRSTFTN